VNDFETVRKVLVSTAEAYGPPEGAYVEGFAALDRIEAEVERLRAARLRAALERIAQRDPGPPEHNDSTFGQAMEYAESLKAIARAALAREEAEEGDPGLLETVRLTKQL
jgi:hypothetical protein